MRQAAAHVQALIEPAVVGLGYELVGIEYVSQGKHSVLRVYIDQEAGISVDDCSAVSHQVSGILDVEDVIRGQYNLEISSPGLDRPLFKLEHFQQFIGRRATVRLALEMRGRRKLNALIKGLNGTKVVLEDSGEEWELSLDAMDKANLVPDL